MPRINMKALELHKLLIFFLHELLMRFTDLHERPKFVLEV